MIPLICADLGVFSIAGELGRQIISGCAILVEPENETAFGLLSLFLPAKLLKHPKVHYAALEVSLLR